MTHIVWDQLEDRTYEAGLDRGVLYFPGGGGVAWNGLVSVEEEPSTTVDPVYYDGVKFNDIIVAGDYSATLKAFTYPDEFLEFEGILEEQDGLFVTDQPQSLFHLSYRTLIGEEGYKIHLLWNLTAIPSTKTYETLSLDSAPAEFEWTLTSVPEPIDNYRPTAHIIIDSRKMDPYLLEDIETILYGTHDEEERVPTMPSMKGLVSFIRKWQRLIVEEHPDGTWTATSNFEGYIEMIDETTFEITSETAIFIDSPANETYEISSTDKNEEDI